MNDYFGFLVLVVAVVGLSLGLLLGYSIYDAHGISHKELAAFGVGQFVEQDGYIGFELAIQYGPCLEAEALEDMIEELLEENRSLRNEEYSQM